MLSKERSRAVYVCVSVVICSLAMCLVDGVIQPKYLVKSLIKVILFLGAPLIYFLIKRDELGAVKGLFKAKARYIFTALGLGAAVYAVILGGYFALKNIFDFSGIVGKLTQDTGVSADNFIFVAAYISVINSFLEEFFFRGFSFMILKKRWKRIPAYVFSSLMFAIYHGGMTVGYFNVGIFLLTLAALFAVGMIFNFLCEKSQSIYVSWLAHMFANLSINTVGCILFGII